MPWRAWELLKKNCQSCTSDFKSVNKIIANIRFQSEQVGFLLVQVDTCGDFNTSSDLIGHTVHNIKVDFFFSVERLVHSPFF